MSTASSAAPGTPLTSEGLQPGQGFGALLWRWRIWAAIGLVVLVYSSSFWGQFVFDDFIIQRDPVMRRIWPPNYAVHHNRPLTHFTFALNYAVSGPNPWSYHLFNLGIHLALGLALYDLFKGMLRRWPDSRISSRACELAGMAALIWAVHPLTTQAVTYVYQRSEAIASLFYVLTLCTYERGHRLRWPWYLLSVLCMLLGSVSKEILITAPVAIIWYDRVFVSESWRRMVRERWWLIAIPGVGIAGLATLLWLNYSTFAGAGVGDTTRMTRWDYLISQPRVLLHYLQLAVLPIGQTIDYGWKAGTFATEWPYGIAIVALLVCTLVTMIYRPHFGFLIGMPWLILSLTSSFVPIVDIIFEHRMYLALGFLMLAAVLMVDHLLYWVSLFWNREKLVATVGGCLTVGVILALGVTTWQRNWLYADPPQLWAEATRVNPQHARAWANLGMAHRAVKNWEPALEAARTAIALDPKFFTAWMTLAEVCIATDRVEEGFLYLQTAIKLNPNSLAANLQMVDYYRTRDPVKAIEYMQHAVKIEPLAAELHVRLAMMLWKNGDRTGAAESFRSALMWDASSPTTHNNYAALLTEDQQWEAAIVELEIAARMLGPDSTPAKNAAILRKHLAQRQ